MHHLCVSIGMCVQVSGSQKKGCQILEAGVAEIGGRGTISIAPLVTYFIQQSLQGCLETFWVHGGHEWKKLKKQWPRALQCTGNCFLHWVTINNPAYIICTAHSMSPRRQFAARLPIPISQNSQRPLKWILHVCLRWCCFLSKRLFKKI